MTKKDSKPQTLQQFPTSALHSMNAPLGGKPSLDQREPGKGSGPGWFVTESADNCGKPGDSNHEEVLLRHQVFSNAIFPTKCFNLVEVAPSCSGTKLTADPRTLKNLDDATCNAPNATSNCHLPRIWSSKELEHILEHHPIFCHNHMMSDNYKPFGSSRVECPCIRRNWWWSMSMTSRKCFRQVANPRTPGIYMKALFCAASCTGQMWARQYLDLLGARVLFSTQASSMFDSARFDSFTEDWPDTHTQTHARTHAPTHAHTRTHALQAVSACTHKVCQPKLSTYQTAHLDSSHYIQCQGCPPPFVSWVVAHINVCHICHAFWDRNTCPLSKDVQSNIPAVQYAMVHLLLKPARQSNK